MVKGTTKKEATIIYLEFLRTIAIILVIFIHTGNRGIYLYSTREYSVLYPFYYFCSVAPKAVAVPLFWMISVSLLIPKKESICALYKRRILKMGLVLLIFSFSQYLYQLFQVDISTFSVVDFLKTLYTSRFATAYWYIYSYLGMLILLPLIRKMASQMSEKEYQYLFGLLLMIYGVIPAVEYLAGGGEVRLNSFFMENISSRWMVLFLLGHYVGNVVPEERLSARKAILLIFAGFMSIVATCLIIRHVENVTGQSGWQNADNMISSLYMLSMFIPSAALFYSARTFFIRYADKIKAGTARCLTVTGGCSFGVMLTENIWRERLSNVYESLRALHCPSILACAIWVTCVWVCGMSVTLILKKVPFIKKLL